MNSDFDNTNNGALFINDRKRGENSPDFKGQCEPACPSCGAIHKFWLSAWKKKTRAGKGFMSLAFTPDDSPISSGFSNNEETPKTEGEDPFDFDDDIPF